MKKISPPGLRVLLLEHDCRDAALVTHALQRADPECTVLDVDSRADFIRALEAFMPDVVLSDHAANAFHGLDALRMTQECRPEAPFILVAGSYERSVANCLKSGAADFVPKSELSRLAAAVNEAVALRAPLRRLTKRQREVMGHLVAGDSTRETARRLRLGIKTVETHRAEVMHRLGLRDLVGLVRYAVQVGMISAGDQPAR